MNEIKTAKVSGKKEVTVDSLQAQVNDLASKVRRMATNWKQFASIHLGADEHDDGKLKGGFVSIWLMALIAMIGMAAGSAFAATKIFDATSYGNQGTAKVETDGGVATLTVDRMAVSGGTLSGGTLTGATNANPVFSGTATGLSLVTNAGPTVTGGTFTGSTNVNPVISGGSKTAGTYAGGTATGMTNANQVATAGTFAGGTYTGTTNVAPVISRLGTNMYSGVITNGFGSPTTNLMRYSYGLVYAVEQQ